MAEEDKKYKEQFKNEYLKYFTEYFDINKLEKRITSYYDLIEDLRVLEVSCPEKTFEHVLSKKKTFISKNAKKLCRDGIPLKYLKTFILKMFNIDYSNEDYENKMKFVLKGRTLKALDNFFPYFDNKPFKESLPVHFLNQLGIDSLKEICWLLNSVVIEIEYCPIILKLTSFLLIFFNKKETYEIMRTLIEMNSDPTDVNSVGWHFRFSYSENQKIGSSICDTIHQFFDKEMKVRYSSLAEIGCTKEKLIQDMSESFFIDYLSFIGVLRFLPFFLYEGARSIYRLIYAVLKQTKCGCVSKGTEQEVLQQFKNESFKINIFKLLFDECYNLKINRINGKFSSQQEKEDDNKANYFLPLFSPKSNIMKDEDIIKLWTLLPLELKNFDGKLLFDKVNSPEGTLTNLYEICDQFEKNSEILFFVQTDKDDIFGGIFKKNIKLSAGGEYELPLHSLLFTITPEIKVYNHEKHSYEVLLFEKGAIRFGAGKCGPALTIDHDMKMGWTEKESVFGKVDLLKDFSRDGEFTIKNCEFYLMI